MRSERLTVTRYIAAVLVGVALLAAVSTAEAYTQVVGGVKVTYSSPGFLVYHDLTDDTLTVEVWQSGGSLSVKATAAALFYWGSYCDVYILADGVDINNIKLKGYDDGYNWCALFVCGYVDYAKKFSLLNGVVGYTDYWGLDFGLYRNPLAYMTKIIKLKWAYTTAPVLPPWDLFLSPPSKGKPCREDVCKSEVSPEDKMALWESVRGEPGENEEEDVEEGAAEVEAETEPVELDVSAGDAVGFFQSLLIGGK